MGEMQTRHSKGGGRWLFHLPRWTTPLGDQGRTGHYAVEQRALAMGDNQSTVNNLNYSGLSIREIRSDASKTNLMVPDVTGSQVKKKRTADPVQSLYV